jgi:hypothetical protein
MPFSSVEKVTVSSGQPLVLPNGAWMQGKLIFTAPDLAVIGAQDVTLGGAVEVPLVDGAFSVQLVATDATGMSPTGWTYTVTAMLTNGPDWIRYVTLPKATASVVLADVVVPDPVAGTYTVLKDPSYIGNVVVSGTPATGKVPTATSATTATWQMPSGGGGSTIVSNDGRINQGIVVLAAAASWTIVTFGGTEIGSSIPAAVGDRIWWSPSFLRTGGVVYLDPGIRLAAGGVSRYASSGTSTPRTEGYAPMYPQSAFTGIAGMRQFIVQAGEVDGSGNATIVLSYKGPADGVNQKLYFGGDYDGFFFVANMGPPSA